MKKDDSGPDLAVAGRVAIDDDKKVITIEPENPLALGSYTVRVLANAVEDTAGNTVATASATFTVTDANVAPVAVDDTASVDRGGSVTIAASDLLANDRDADDDPLRVTRVGAMNGGTVTPTENEDDTALTAFTYNHDSDADPNEGTSFTYTVSDGRGGEDTGRVVITVTPTNRAPAFEQASYEFELEENRDGRETPVALGAVSATDPDTDDTIAYALTRGDANLFAIDASGFLSYIGPGENFESEPDSYELTVTAIDGRGLSATATVTVTVMNVNEAPVFEQASYEFELEENRDGRGTAVALGAVSATDPDTDDTIAYALTRGDANLFAIDAASGVLSYIGPGEDFESEPNRHELTVSATDREGLSAEAEVAVTVTDEEAATARARLKRVNAAILPELSRAIVSGVVDMVADRIEEARSGVAGEGRVAIAGRAARAAADDEEILERVRSGEAQDRWREALDAETMDWKETPDPETMEGKEALRGTSFALPLGGEGGWPGGLGKVTVWGGGDWRRLSGGDGGSPVEWDGDVVGALLGVEARLRDDLLAGLALSWSRGTFNWTDRGKAGYREMEGTHESGMASAHPYVGWWPGEGTSLWASLGYGRGDVEIEDDEAGRQTSDAALSTAAVGGRVQLFSIDDLIEGGTTALALWGEAWLSRFGVEDNGDRMAALRVDANRLRLGLEGAYERRLAGGGSLTPSLEAGVRHDGGDGETGLGVELSGGLAWRDPALGLTVEGRGRALLMRRGGIGEWGASGSVLLDPGAGGLGPSFGLRPSWGAAAEGGVGRLWEDGPDSPFDRAAANDGETPSPAAGLEAELGYGLEVLDGHGVLTPYGGLSLSDGGSRSWRVGGRLAIGPSLSLGLEGQRRKSANEAPDHGVTLTATANW